MRVISYVSHDPRAAHKKETYVPQHASHGLVFDWRGDPGLGLEADRRSLADQYQLCHDAGASGSFAAEYVDGVLTYLVSRSVSLTLGISLLVFGTVLIA